ncbi:MAG: hypothetical protein ACO4AJ_11630, partial [Prochlorothrix sp.]
MTRTDRDHGVTTPLGALWTDRCHQVWNFANHCITFTAQPLLSLVCIASMYRNGPGWGASRD